MKNQIVATSPFSYEDKILHHIPFPNNMGMVRYGLAFAVVVAHFNALTGSSIYFPLSSYAAVGGFFALSGFLMYPSYFKRQDLKKYVNARARRILPAYFLTVVVAAILLCFLSTLSAWEYFSSPGFWKYLGANLSFLNFLDPVLPGVFSGNVMPEVNASLWTMKVEWSLYLSLPLVFYFMNRFRGKHILWFLGIMLFAIMYRFFFSYLYLSSGKPIYKILERQFFGQCFYFYFGSFLYYLLPLFIKYKWPIFFCTLLLQVISGMIPYFYSSILVQPVVVSVMVIWFSIVGRWGTWEGKYDNLSYNIYLCHFPIIQSFITLGGGKITDPIVEIVICSFIIVGVSIMLMLAEKGVRRVWK
ncbi:MAG: acyltransferase [Muribaculaceae bacterium]|nr:acyltransferase [Muribaculaceae bacterium]